jgi:hypothetical protein
MRTLIRTAVIILIAYLIGQITPPNAILLPIMTTVVVVGAFIDCFLYLKTGRGLLDHLIQTK